MAAMENAMATDSGTELNRRIGDDATATYENDPTFFESNPTNSASSGNVEVQRSTEDSDDSDEELDDEAAEEDDLDEEDEEDDVDEEAEANSQNT